MLLKTNIVIIYDKPYILAKNGIRCYSKGRKGDIQMVLALNQKLEMCLEKWSKAV